MEFSLLGWPPDGPTLQLDYRRFSYAGKFVMSSTGKAVARPESGGEIVGATAFNEDRTDAETLWIRYVTVRDDYRGEGVGPPLLTFTVARARDRGYERVKIAVNNPFAYQAAYRAGFVYVGEETGVAELVMETGDTADADSYQSGLDVFRNRDVSDPEADFLRAKVGVDPPETLVGPE
ncbi:GNAT family N-acetyltransferase [Haloarculaceae archaeon H-GB2-1]|nr:GNAT family N-acetyltransferase [Haloarculaceae archaeon H-GB1-1]MEA5387189.1 GNAT family N-acetyltransferase [Haloarculaceae archaeon H-GB11]MEA5408682.1 GNAT family N-acetyltransferase [Haloarculaceae archaeon H-GB2-1]